MYPYRGCPPRSGKNRLQAITSGSPQRLRILDCILIHVPKLLEWSPYFGWYSRITFLPMGMLSLAEEAQRAGFRVRLVHLGVEKALDPHWSLVDYVRQSGAKVVALSLHWHPQTFDTLDVAQQLKAHLPHVKVVLGGLTASVFAEQVMRDFTAVDAVIQGEAEIPLRMLLECRDDLSKVPNLWWRDGANIRHNRLTYVSSVDELSGWTFAAWDLIEHSETVLRLSWRYSWEPELAGWRLKDEPTLFGLPLGRGCSGTCSWCAGSRGTMAATTGRRRIAWRSPEAVVATIETARTHGVQRFYACFDPHPATTDQLVGILEALGRLEPKVKLDFESYGLPTAEFIHAFWENLHSASRLLLSPETVDEELRRRHRAFHFSNAELQETLARLDELGLQTCLYFVVGLPGEDRASVLRTREYQAELRRRFACIDEVFSWPLEMEPHAPWFNEPHRFGLSLRRRTLRDFYEGHRRPDFALGYDLELLDESEILGLYEEFFLGLSASQRLDLAMHWRRNKRDYSVIRRHGPRV